MTRAGEARAQAIAARIAEDLPDDVVATVDGATVTIRGRGLRERMVHDPRLRDFGGAAT